MNRSNRLPLSSLFLIFSLGLIASPATASAKGRSRSPIRVDCDRGKTIAGALSRARAGDTVQVTGTCQENVVVTTDDLILDGQSTTTLNAGTGDGITVDGARRVTLTGLTVVGGTNGVVITGGASVEVLGTSVRQSAERGILITGNSSGKLTDSSVDQAGGNGVDVEGSSLITFGGSFASRFSGAFGINLIGTASAILRGATVTLSGNALGLQVALNSSFLVEGTSSVLNADNNFVVGVTVVSNSELFVLRGQVTARGNGLRGASIFSGSTVELDNGAILDVSNNALDGILLDKSTANLFNMPTEPGARLLADGNARFGVRLLQGSTLDVGSDGAVSSRNNAAVGLFLDDGSTATLINSTVTGNGLDASLTFGSRADLSGNTIGLIACDGTVLLRGTTGVTCPSP